MATYRPAKMASLVREIVSDAILAAVERRIHERTVPRRNPALVTARFLRLFLPGLLRRGMAQVDPVPPDVVARARERAARKQRVGDLR